MCCATNFACLSCPLIYILLFLYPIQLACPEGQEFVAYKICDSVVVMSAADCGPNSDANTCNMRLSSKLKKVLREVENNNRLVGELGPEGRGL